MTIRDRLTLTLVYAACVLIAGAWWVFVWFFGRESENG